MPIPPDLTGPAPLPELELDQFLALVTDIADESHVAIGMVTEAMADPRAEPDGPGAAAAVWQPTDLSGAEWCARKAAAAKAAIADIEAQAAEWRDPIDRWEHDASKRHRATVALMELKLAAFALGLREAEPNAKTLDLPSAVVKTTRHSPKVVIEDKAAVIAYLQPRPGLRDLVHTSHDVLVSELRDTIKPSPIATGRYVLTLDCGCTVTDSLEHLGIPADRLTDSEGNVWAAGIVLECISHDRKATVVQAEQATKMLPVLNGSATVVPGLAVEPAHTTAKVATKP